MLPPLVFSPFFRPQVWGSRRLAERFGKPLPAGVYGESWELSDHPLHVSRVASGPLQGTTLNELWTNQRAEFAGNDAIWQRRSAPGGRFPLLIKFLDCHELLSVQVHPDDQLAKRWAPAEAGKTEAWVVLEAAPTARIYAGLRAGVTAADLERRLDQGTVAECLHEIVPQVGEVYFLPAGTVHALGGGLLVAEVQQNSDATFRLFDWNRPGLDGKPRALHREAALATIDWKRGPVAAALPQIITPAGWSGDNLHVEQLIDCEHFTLRRVRFAGQCTVPTGSQLSIWMILKGTATFAAAQTTTPVAPGEILVVPACVPSGLWSTFSGQRSLCVIPSGSCSGARSAIPARRCSTVVGVSAPPSSSDASRDSTSTRAAAGVASRRGATPSGGTAPT